MSKISNGEVHHGLVCTKCGWEQVLSLLYEDEAELKSMNFSCSCRTNVNHELVIVTNRRDDIPRTISEDYESF